MRSEARPVRRIMSDSKAAEREKRTRKEKRDRPVRGDEKPAEHLEKDTVDTAPKDATTEKRTKKERRSRRKDEDEAAEQTKEESPSTRKRKRDALADEIEIDINLPEPASKKAARKAKKVKVALATGTSGTTAPVNPEKPATTGSTDTSGKRSEFGVWIGNLPWSATKDMLLTFLTSSSDITTAEITRVHLPPPTKPPNPNWTSKPLNKGFAYVDFSTQLAMYSAIALTETKMDGRALLIKNAKSFEGRPEKPKAEEGGTGSSTKEGHPPNKRVFVGNLAFDVTKEDLQTHFGRCGDVLDIHMATFEDSGKCKGYAWITFENVDAATSAVRGYIYKDENSKHEKIKNDDSDSEPSNKKKERKRKWYVNQLMGRELRCEFAEDSTVRYNKRHGKKNDDADMTGMHPDRARQLESDAPNERPPRSNRPFKPRPKIDARTIPSGKAHASAPRASQAIVEGTGKKISFD